MDSDADGCGFRGTEKVQMTSSDAEKSQIRYARLAGFMFLWLIITGLAGALTISHIAGSGTFGETAKRVVASEHLYRVALSSELVETLSAVLLAFRSEERRVGKECRSR